MDEVDNICLLEDGATQRLLAYLAQFEALMSAEIPVKLMRLKLLCEYARSKAEEIRTSYHAEESGSQMDVDVRNDGTQFDKNVKNMENLIKLCL